jgi:hypothetical protein
MPPSKNGRVHSSNGSTAVLEKPPIEVVEVTKEILPLDLGEFLLHIRGLTPLIMHRWDEKPKK